MVNLSKVGDYWYKIHNQTVNRRVEIQVQRFRVIKVNPKSVWLEVFGDKKIAYLGAVRKFAYPTPEAAMESFKARKDYQIKLLMGQLADAQKALQILMQCRTDVLALFEDKGFSWGLSSSVHLPGEYRHYSQAYYDEMGY